MDWTAYQIKVFKAYENPLCGSKTNPYTRLSLPARDRRLAQPEARDAARPGPARFAQSRLLALAGARGP